MYLEIILLILSIAFLLLAAFLVPFLIQIWRTINNINISLQILNRNLPGILKNIEEITSNINNMTSIVNKQIENLLVPVIRIQSLLLDFIIGLENALPAGIRKIPLYKALRSLTAVLKGIRTFIRVYRS